MLLAEGLHALYAVLVVFVDLPTLVGIEIEKVISSVLSLSVVLIPWIHFV
jgi:hypothetical protein